MRNKKKSPTLRNMELGLGNTLIAGDPRLVDHIVGEVKSQGIFDQFRKECIADVDTKPAYQNLRTRVESSVNSFLSKQTWRADLNKNQLRETLRKHIHDAPYLDAGVERIVDQVVNPKVYSVFMPQIEDVVYKFLGLERPKNRQRNGPCGYKDLLPKDLDPVSPESDKNSLRDVSLDSVDANIDDTSARETCAIPSSNEKISKDEIDSERHPSRNGNSNETEKSSEETSKSSGTLTAVINLGSCGKSEDKPDEEEEDSPTFEPIDIMNLNESNVSNDSHLSGISELTSHRSRSPDFSNETSRDNMDFSNQDSQFSKVSSDSRLSIVTDFGSSNHASTPLSDNPKDDRDRSDVKYPRDNFKAVREFETSRSRDSRTSYEMSTIKDETKIARRSFTPKETSRDGTDLSKDGRESREKNCDAEASRSRATKETKKEKEVGKKPPAVEAKNDNRVKKIKDKSEASRDSSADKSKDASIKSKDERLRELERRESIVGKEIKDLKDMYKEKIRELREKKELTEKEKLMKDTRLSKETGEKRDSSRESKRDSKGASSKAHCSSRSENKASSKTTAKDSRSDSREKGKREERKYSKDHRSKNSSGSQCASDSGEKTDGKRVSRSEKDERTEKLDVKQDSRQKIIGKILKSDSGKGIDGKRDTKGETEARDKKRRDDKKTKIKDDHSSLRKHSDDRRSTDRDGSNGSNGKSSQKYNSSSNSTATKPVATSLSKETTTTSNSSSETSDSIEEKQNEKLLISGDSKNLQISKIAGEDVSSIDGVSSIKRLDVGQKEISLPIKKRPLPSEACSTGVILMKKPKFAKNLQEAKRLVKIRRRMEREKVKRETIIEMSSNETIDNVATAQKIVSDDLQSVPDDERVQIIEVCDEEYDEPYPEIQCDFTPEERSQIILGDESIFTSDVLAKRFNAKSTLSEMELSIRQSLKEMITDNKIDETKDASINSQNSLEPDTEAKIEETVFRDENTSELMIIETKDSSEVTKILSNLTEDTEHSRPRLDSTKILASPEPVVEEQTKQFEDENYRKDDGIASMSERVLSHDISKSTESVELTNFPSSKREIVEEEGRIDKNIVEKEKIDDIVEEKGNIDEIIEERGNIKEIVEETAKMNDIVEDTAEIKEIVEETNEIKENIDEKAKINDIVEEKANTSEIVKGEEAKDNDQVEEVSEINEIVEESPKMEAHSIETIKNIGSSISTEVQETAIKTSVKENAEDSCNKSKTKSQNRASMDEEICSFSSDDEGPCLYFIEDNEKLEKFTKFMKTLELEEFSSGESPIEMFTNEIASSVTKPMAPPKPKRKYSTSPLTDILLNNTNNNNEPHKIIEPMPHVEDVNNSLKKRKIGRPKKQRINASLCGQQNLSNGENFVMPLSPESDVSATSEKTPSNPLKDEKSRPRGSNQRYTSDDLYKPRPLFSSSSRRSRRSNQP